MKILVIEACGLHLGYLGCYGNDWVGTPNLDRIAAEGIVFDTHIVDQPELSAETAWELRSVGMGCYALPGMPPAAPVALKPQVARLASLASFAADAQAVVGSNAPWTWIEGPSLLPPWTLENEMMKAYFDEDEIEEGLEPWPDPPLDVLPLSEADVLCLQSTYAAVVTVFDAQIGALLDWLGATKALDDTFLCVTARSGLPLGEHGMIGAPRPWLHDELVHVPLLMRLPHAAEAGSRFAALTQPIDLLPTFHETLGQPAPAMHGHNLWPLIRGEVDQLRSHAIAAMRVADHESWLLRPLDAALHLPIAQPEGAAARLPLFFLKPEDRWEANDLYQQQIETAEAMEKTLREMAASIRDEAR